MNEPKTRKGQATKTKMIEVAAQLIHKNGVTATTVNDVLQMSNTGKSQFSHYFGSKEQLIQAVIGFHQQKCLTSLENKVKNIKSLHDLPGFCESMVDECQKYLDLHHSGCPIGQIALELPGEQQLQKQISELFQHLNKVLAERFRTLQAEGKIKSGINVEELAEFFNCAIHGGKLVSKTQQKTTPLRRCLKHASSYLALFAAN